MYRTVLSSLLLVGVLLVSTPVYAQSVDPVTLSITPKYPRPHENVTVTVGSTLLNLAASSITIKVDGVEVSGERTGTFKTGNSGIKSVVSATVVTNNQTYTKQLTVIPAEVALIMEPQTTAHPLYDGGRLVAPNAQVRLIALADIRTSSGRVAEKDLSYTWKVGEQVLNNYSGLGKNVLDTVAPVRYRDAQVSVTVSTKDGTQSAYASVFISPITPIVRIYENNPLFGFNGTKALSGSFTLSGAEETFRAVPYFFANTPTFSWTLNGTSSGTDKDVTVRTTGTSAGSAQLAVSASDTSTAEQAQSRFTLQFGSASTNIFGF